MRLSLARQAFVWALFRELEAGNDQKWKLVPPTFTRSWAHAQRVRSRSQEGTPFLETKRHAQHETREGSREALGDMQAATKAVKNQTSFAKRTLQTTNGPGTFRASPVDTNCFHSTAVEKSDD